MPSIQSKSWSRKKTALVTRKNLNKSIRPALLTPTVEIPRIRMIRVKSLSGSNLRTSRVSTYHNFILLRKTVNLAVV